MTIRIIFGIFLLIFLLAILDAFVSWWQIRRWQKDSEAERKSIRETDHD
jgi:DNA-binding transcriptional regulator of glucitol operon